MGLGGKLKVGTLYNRVNRTRLLAKAAVNTFRHVYVIPCRPSTSIWAWFSFDCDGLSRAHSLTQLTSDTPFFSIRVPPECMLAPESRAEWSLLEWVVEGGWLSEHPTHCHHQTSYQLCGEEGLCIPVHDWITVSGHFFREACNVMVLGCLIFFQLLWFLLKVPQSSRLAQAPCWSRSEYRRCGEVSTNHPLQELRPSGKLCHDGMYTNIYT